MQVAALGSITATASLAFMTVSKRDRSYADHRSFSGLSGLAVAYDCSHNASRKTNHATKPNSRDDVKSYPAEAPLSIVPDHNSCSTAATFLQRHPVRNASPTVWAYASISCNGILRRNG